MKVYIDIDAQPAHQELNELEAHREEVESDVEETVQEVDTSLADSYTKCLNMARGAYLVGLGMVKSTGATVSYFFRAAISAVFSTAAMLKPLLFAKAITTGDWVNFGIGMASLSVAIASAVAAQAKQSELARGLRGIDMSLLGLQQLIGMMNF